MDKVAKFLPLNRVNQVLFRLVSSKILAIILQYFR